MIYAGVACSMLSETDLDATSRKVLKLCESELVVVASTGTLKRDGLLRSILVSTALALRLDSQELESLNSMIKIAVQRAQNPLMTLELLSSRVCMRKTISMLTGGSSKFRVVEPIASQVADSCFLHSPNYVSVLQRVDRWAPATDMTVCTPNRTLWDPLALPSRSVFWARPWNKQLVAKFKEYGAKNHKLLGLIVPVISVCSGNRVDAQTWRVYIPGEMSRSICMLLPLTLGNTGGTPPTLSSDTRLCDLHELNNDLRTSLACIVSGANLSLDQKAKPVASISVIADLFDGCKLSGANPEHGLDCLRLIELDYNLPMVFPTHQESVEPHAQAIEFISSGSLITLCNLKKIRSYRPRAKKQSEPEPVHMTMPLDACDEGDDGDDDLDKDMTHEIEALMNEALGVDAVDANHKRNERDDITKGVNSDDHGDDCSYTPTSDEEIVGDRHGTDDIAEIKACEDMNDDIASAASVAFQKKHKTDVTLDGHDHFLDDVPTHLQSLGAMQTCAARDEEAWLKQILLGSNMEQAQIVTFSNNPLDQCDAVNVNGSVCDDCDSDDNAQEFGGPVPFALPSIIPPSHQSIFVAADLWKTSIQTTAECLKDKHDSSSRSVGENNELSLIALIGGETPRVDFVHWQNSVTMMGRPIELDEVNGIVCPVYYLLSASSWKGAVVIHPATGCFVRKVKKSQRPKCPLHLVRLREIFRFAVESVLCEQSTKLLFTSTMNQSNTDNTSSDWICCCCTKATRFRCICCLMYWHVECADIVHQRVLKAAQLPNQDLPADCLLNVFVLDSSQLTNAASEADTKMKLRQRFTSTALVVILLY